MGTDRKIKSDGQVHIESTNVDIDSTVDITGDVNATGDIGGATSTITGDASVGGDFTVTGDTSTTDLTASGTGSFTGNLSVSSINNLTFPSADGTNGQAIITDGSGALSFGDVASGGGADVDTIANASDATNYSGTARFIEITASVDITFPETVLEDRIIYANTTSNIDITFQAGLTNCQLYLNSNNFLFTSPYDSNDTSGPGGTTSSSTRAYFEQCKIYAENIYFKSGYYIPNPGSTPEQFFHLFAINKSDIKSNRFYIQANSGLDATKTYDSNPRNEIWQTNITTNFFYISLADTSSTSYYYLPLNLISQCSVIRCISLQTQSAPNGLSDYGYDVMGNIDVSNNAILSANTVTSTLVGGISFPRPDTILQKVDFTDDNNDRAMCNVTCTGSSQSITSSSATKYTGFGGYQVVNNFNSTDITNNQRFKVPLRGTYQISMQGRIASLSDGDLTTVRMKRNGSSILPNFAFVYKDNSSGGNQTHMFTLPACSLSLTAGDYIEVEFDSNSDTAYTVVVDYFSIVKMNK